jgi:RND superfamily putative drug exporter
MRPLRTVGIRAPKRTLMLVIATGVVAAILGVGAPDHMSNSEKDFLSPGTDSYRGSQMLDRAFGTGALPNLGVIFAVGPHGDGANVLAAVQKVATLVPQPTYSTNKRYVAMMGFFNRGVASGPAALSLAKRFQSIPGVAIGGTALAGEQFSDQVKRDVITTELVALPLIILLGLWIFRGVVAALLPVFTGSLALAMALLGIRVVSTVHTLSIFSLNVVTGVAVGLSIDYSLLLVSRFREELEGGLGTCEAASKAVATAGRTVLLSATTVVAAAGSLLVFPLNVVRSIAVGGMMVSAIAGATALIALPAVFVLLGPRVNSLAPRRWQRAVKRAARPAEQGAWYRIARFVMRWPAGIAVAAIALLLLLAAPTLRARLIGFDASALPADTSAHRFEELAKHEFTHSLFDEIVILTHGSAQAAHELVDRYLAHLPDVATGEVRQAKGDLWVIYLKPAHPPFSGATKRLVRRIRALPAKLMVTGVTADYIDTAGVLKALLPLALVLLATTTATFVFIATGSVILPLKTFIMNIFSVAAAFGLVIFVFQDGRLEGLLRYRSLGALALTQPLVLGAGTFGILTDYGIFLLTRIKEGWDAGLSNREAVALGLERTGRVITAAALLLCVTIGALVTAKLVFAKEIGFGIAAAVAIDATIVRAFLVPSLMVLLGRWNWWRPSLLRRRTPRLEHFESGARRREGDPRSL